MIEHYCDQPHYCSSYGARYDAYPGQRYDCFVKVIADRINVDPSYLKRSIPKLRGYYIRDDYIITLLKKAVELFHPDKIETMNKYLMLL